MSTAPVSTSAAPPVTHPPAGDRFIRVIQHSSLFYWWPVWVFALLFALISLFDGTRALHLTSTARIDPVMDETGKAVSGKYTILDKDHPARLDERVHGFVVDNLQPRVSHYSWMGTVFSIILLLVIVITNVPMRGLWSVVVIVIVILGSIIITIMEWWDVIARGFVDLRIYIGFAGFFTIGIILLAVWLFSVLVFDRQTYIIFTPGQMKVCEEIGAGEKVYDTAGMNLEKHRDDLFRHWVLGMGSGDLTVRTQAGGQVHEIRMSNVLFVHRKLLAIEDMQREKATVQGD